MSMKGADGLAGGVLSLPGSWAFVQELNIK